MPGVPSNKACKRCKKRHLKCDETHPKCQRCTDAGVDCPGFPQTRKFIDQGESVRRRYAPYPGNASQPNKPTAGAHMPISEQAEASAQARHSESLPESHSAPTTHAETRPGISRVDSGLQRPPPAQSAQSSRAQSTDGSASRPISDSGSGPPPWQPPRINAQQPFRALGNHATNPLTLNTQYLPHTLPGAPPLPGSPSESGSQEEYHDIFSELMTGTEHELCFLVRYFCDAIAAWFDVTDAGRYFATYLPVRAIDEPSLRSAIAAISAMQLARLKGTKAATEGGRFTSPATMETYPNIEQVDWSLKATHYYYLAVSQMNTLISDYAVVSTSAIFEAPISIVNRWASIQRTRTQSNPSAPSDSTWKVTENLLASSALLTVYKFLEEPGEHWQSLMAGVKPLFSQLSDLCTQRNPTDPHFPPGVAAVFWNYARLDYLASYYLKLPTHLDPDDFGMWQAAGLPIDDQGNSSSPDTVLRRHAPSLEGIATNTLTRLLNKLTNFLAAAKKAQLEQWVGQPSPEPSTSPSRSSIRSLDAPPTLGTWLKLSFEFQSWAERLTETFRPCLRIERPSRFSSPLNDEQIPFPEIFYSSTACASAMQQYHFGRLALTLNRPSDDIAGPTTSFDRLQGYRDLTKEVDHRCREICGIALGRPQVGARVQMVTLLYAVGQCMEKPEERKIVIDLLRGIEADLGWSTSSQVQKLEK
ncbi:uncharacterized protein BDV17DRAFT_276407 [Aspergillus undulatus]|uniref:uncharacterized protein n=1 Tax=Aspergillus undulatus TaxID=1810928 RepID=UPI003CCD2637